MSARLDRAMILLRQSRPELAENELRAALGEEPNDAVAHAFLSLCLLELKRYDEATSEAAEAIRLAPDFPFAHAALARVMFERNRLQRADEAISEAIRLDPSDPSHRSLKAAIRMNQRRWSEALQAAEEGLALDAEHVECNNLRAMALVKLGRRDEAGLTIEGALARDPDNAVTHANRGWSLLDQGDPRQAQEHFREALRLDPQLEWARFGIVEALKARNPIYRMMLQYFLWMSKLSRSVQIGVLLAWIFGRRALASVGAANPGLRPITSFLLIATFVFLIMTWVSVPLFNLLLRLDRFGRLALSREQIVGSNWLGACLLAVFASLGASLATGSGAAWLLTIQFFLLLLPLGGAIMCPAGWPKRVMIGVTALLLLCGPGTMLLSGLAESVNADPRLGLRELASGGTRVFIPGVVLSTWLGVILAQVDPRK